MGLEGLIKKVEENVSWDSFDIDENKPDVSREIIDTLVRCCESYSVTLKDAVDTYKYFYPDTTLTDSQLEDMFSDAAEDGGCDVPPDPDPGPPDPGPGDWPNDVIPDDGPPENPDIPESPNRGARCEGYGLTGGPDFEQFSNDPAECAGGSSIGIFNIDMFSGKWAKQSVDLALPAKGFSWIISRTYNATQQRKDGADYVFVHSNGMQGYDWRQDSLPQLVKYSNPNTLYLVVNAQTYLTFDEFDDGSDLWVPTGSKGGAVMRTVNTAGTTDIEVFEVYDLSGLKMSFFGFSGQIDQTKMGQLWKIEDPAGNVAYIGHETEPDTALSDGFTEVGSGSGNYAVKNAYDTSGRLYRYEYSASPIDEDPSGGAHRLTSITVYPEDDINDPIVAKVEYDYYDWDTYVGPSDPLNVEDPDGLPGDLKLVKVSTPTSITTPSVEYIVERTHYRYWKDGEDGDDVDEDPQNPDADGFDHAIKYIYDSEGLRRADIDLLTSDGDHRTDDVLDESTAALKVYAAQYMEYNDTTYHLTNGTINDRRIKKVWGNGECGCGGTSAAGNGTHLLTYDSYSGVYSPNTSGALPWYGRTMIEFPKATASEPNATTGGLKKFETIYFGVGGSKIATVITEEAPATATDAWVSLTKYDYLSLGASQFTPAAISSYSHSDGSFTEAATGLVYEYVPWDLSEISASIDDRNYGRTRFVGWKSGGAASVSAYLSETEQEFATATLSTGGDSTTLAKPFVLRTQRYPDGGTTSDATGHEETTITRTFYSGIGTSDVESLRVESETVNQPGVSNDEHGNGLSDHDPTTTYYRLDGTISWVKEPDGVLSYTQYAYNQPFKIIEDANTSSGDVSGDVPSGLSSTLGAKHVVTEYSFDDQRRLTKVILPHGREYFKHYDVLDNGLIVNLSFPVHSSGTVNGPGSFSLMGHNRSTYQSGSVALDPMGKTTSGASSWVDASEEDAFDVFGSLGDLARLSESIYDEPGEKMVASREYYDIDGSPGNQYDETTYSYDDRGRPVRIEAPHGTVTRTTFDGLGRTVKQWMGTNDSDFPGSSGSGDNMVQLSETVYDYDGVGNSLVTKSTQIVNSVLADRRVTEYTYDVRNRLVIQKNPEKPHAVMEYDNLSRPVYSATYSDVSALDADTVASDEEGYRLSLSQSLYDTRGRVYESRTYEINQSTGAKIPQGSDYYHLVSKRWFSDIGQIVKTTGRSITKSTYDRLRRPIAQYSLSSVNESDSSYTDTDDLDGDYVLSEKHTLWDDDSGLALASMLVDRHPNDTLTTGALFTLGSTPSLWEESDDLHGRVRIAAMWYDGHDRMTQSVNYGTYGLDSTNDGESFNRLDSTFDTAPTPTELVGTTETGHFVINVYNEDGEVEEVRTPNDESDMAAIDRDWYVATKTEYDDLGRVIQRVENWNGDTSPTPALPDINRITEMQYTDGLMTKQIAKNAKESGGSTVIDSQHTAYNYGTTESVSTSDVATGHLLKSVYYPDALGSGGGQQGVNINDGVFYEYNAVGQQKKISDQAGNIIEIEFDGLGRTTKRHAENIVSGFDDYVDTIETDYDSRGLVSSVKQYGGTSSATLRDSIELEYDNWGLLETSSQDLVGSGLNLLDVEYTTEWSLGQVSGVRRTGVEYPSGAKATYYYGAFGSIDYNLSRTSRVDYDYDGPGGDSSTYYASYTYGGQGNLLHTALHTSGSQKYCSYYDPSDTDGYAHLDNFGRPTKSFWAHDNSNVTPAIADLSFYDVDLEYDVASNIVRINDHVTNRDQTLTVDDFRRLTKSEFDTNGNSVPNADQESYTYDHLGNWQSFSYDADMDTIFELEDDRIFNLVNEITDRDLTTIVGGTPATVAKDPVYDDVGNMTEDGRYYEYKYDAFGRITQVTDSATSNVVAEYKYNGLFQRTITRTDADNSGSLDSEEYHHVYDDKWRVVEVFRKPVSGSRDSEPKESTLYHAAGVSGSSSPLDSVIARFRSNDDDVSGGTPEEDWSAQADGEMNKITWYFQNWRGDVVFISGHGTTERIEYTPYGTPKGYGAGDQNSDGGVTSTDYSAWLGNQSSGNALADVNFDGAVGAPDYSAWLNEYNNRGGTTGGIGILSPWLDNNIGYAGYRMTDQTLTTVWHVRHRELVPEIGVWTRRDPLGYVDGFSLYNYAKSTPIMYIDSMGLACGPCGCGSGCGGAQPKRAALYIDLQDDSWRPNPKEYDDALLGKRILACQSAADKYAQSLGLTIGDACYDAVAGAYYNWCKFHGGVDARGNLIIRDTVKRRANQAYWDCLIANPGFTPAPAGVVPPYPPGLIEQWSDCLENFINKTWCKYVCPIGWKQYLGSVANCIAGCVFSKKLLKTPIKCAKNCLITLGLSAPCTACFLAAVMPCMATIDL